MYLFLFEFLFSFPRDSNIFFLNIYRCEVCFNIDPCINLDRDHRRSYFYVWYLFSYSKKVFICSFSIVHSNCEFIRNFIRIKNWKERWLLFIETTNKPHIRVKIKVFTIHFLHLETFQNFIRSKSKRIINSSKSQSLERYIEILHRRSTNTFQRYFHSTE